MARKGRCQGSRGGYVCWQPVVEGTDYCQEHTELRARDQREAEEHYRNHINQPPVAGCIRCEVREES